MCICRMRAVLVSLAMQVIRTAAGNLTGRYCRYNQCTKHNKYTELLHGGRMELRGARLTRLEELGNGVGGSSRF